MKFKHRGQDVPTIEAEQFYSSLRPLPKGVWERAHGSEYVINANGKVSDVVDGDWIIQETFGDDVRARPCKPKVFQEHYEPVMTMKELVEELRPMWAEEPVAGFPLPTDPVDPPLTMDGLAERVTAIEERLGERPNADFGGIPQVSTDHMLGPSARKLFQQDSEIIRADAAEFNRLEVVRLKRENERLTIENAEFSAEVLRLGDIVRTFNQQSVSVS